ncbi:hypothetical protein MMC08_007415, partial [Hypocenomyce scalaris]|nr:hypothetical protein [Hypocenomyce scalaris]
MALSPSTAPSLTSFRALSFDIYGTLIDWSTGRSAAVEPLTSQLPNTHEAKTSRAAQNAAFDKLEVAIQQEHPSMPYEDVLAAAYTALAREWGVTAEDRHVEAIGRALGTWAPFPDTIEAMKTLGKHYKLIAISNVSEKGIAETLAGPLRGVHFDAVLTAEAIGSYKPDLRNFEYLLEKAGAMGVEKGGLLLVAEGVGSDHVPAKQIGLASAWIARQRPRGEKGFDGIGEEYEGKVAFGWRWSTLGEMAGDVETAFRERSTSST